MSYILRKNRFDKIYTNSFDILYHFVKKNIRDEHLAADIVQETYIRIWENLDQIQDDEKIVPLLRKYATNILINTIHQQQKRAAREKVYCESQEVLSYGQDPLHVKEMAKCVNEAIASMPMQVRKIYKLKREMGMNHQEIAEALNISVYTIDRHMNKALRILRNKILETNILALIALSQNDTGVRNILQPLYN